MMECLPKGLAIMALDELGNPLDDVRVIQPGPFAL